MTAPNHQVIALMDDWLKRYPKEEALVFWFREDSMQMVGTFAEEFVCQEYNYENAMALQGIHRRYILCIVSADIGTLWEKVYSMTTSKDSQIVIIK